MTSKVKNYGYEYPRTGKNYESVIREIVLKAVFLKGYIPPSVWELASGMRDVGYIPKKTTRKKLVAAADELNVIKNYRIESRLGIVNNNDRIYPLPKEKYHDFAKQVWVRRGSRMFGKRVGDLNVMWGFYYAHRDKETIGCDISENKRRIDLLLEYKKEIISDYEYDYIRKVLNKVNRVKENKLKSEGV